jgi:hypothetical protein
MSKMDKHTLYGRWHRYKTVTLALLFIGLLTSVSFSIYGLRANNLKMIHLREAVYTADEQNGDIAGTLKNLRDYVFSHMNTNLRPANSTEPPIQLVNQFNRIVAAEQARIEALGGANQVYVEAQRKCEVASVSLMARAQCIQQYVSEHGNGVPQLNLPPKEFYTFDFASPRWSPDLAGWALVFSGLFTLLLIVRLIAGRFIHHYLKK